MGAHAQIGLWWRRDKALVDAMLSGIKIGMGTAETLVQGCRLESLNAYDTPHKLLYHLVHGQVTDEILQVLHTAADRIPGTRLLPETQWILED
jgi:hypothetical protein